MTSWNISNWKPIGKNTLVGSFTLEVDPLAISDMTLHQKDGQRWVNFPAKEYLANGERRFAQVVRIPDDQAYRRFQEWCQAELDKIMPVDTADAAPPDDDIPF